jgi:hypothetical protein
MRQNANQLHYQVAQALEGLAGLTEKERMLEPTKAFGENYNNLLVLSKEVMPSVDPRRWPPTLGFRETAAGNSYTISPYMEIVSYLKQVGAILSEGEY